MIKETDIAWLAGFIDADGCFTVQIYKSLAVKSYVEIKPFITINQIVRKNNAWIEKAGKILDDLGITYGKRIQNYATYSTCRIDIRSIKSVNKFIPHILPHLTVKKGVAKIMLEELPTGKRVSFRGKNFDKKTGRFVKTKHIKRDIDWTSIYKAANFVDKIRHFNTPQSGSKGRANVRWRGKDIINFYRKLETS